MSKSLKLLHHSFGHSYYEHETASRPLYMITAQKAAICCWTKGSTAAGQKKIIAVSQKAAICHLQKDDSKLSSLLLGIGCLLGLGRLLLLVYMYPASPHNIGCYCKSHVSCWWKVRGDVGRIWSWLCHCSLPHSLGSLQTKGIQLVVLQMKNSGRSWEEGVASSCSCDTIGFSKVDISGCVSLPEKSGT